MHNCINLIKISINHKKKGFIIINNKKNLTIIKQFIKIGIIKYAIIKNEFIMGFINYVNDRPVFSKILNFYKSSNNKYISLKNIIKMSSKYNWVLILSTNKGIINSIEAIELRVGGLIIAKLSN